MPDLEHVLVENRRPDEGRHEGCGERSGEQYDALSGEQPRRQPAGTLAPWCLRAHPLPIL